MTLYSLILISGNKKEIYLHYYKRPNNTDNPIKFDYVTKSYLGKGRKKNDLYFNAVYLSLKQLSKLEPDKINIGLCYQYLPEQLKGKCDINMRYHKIMASYILELKNELSIPVNIDYIKKNELVNYIKKLK